MQKCRYQEVLGYLHWDGTSFSLFFSWKWEKMIKQPLKGLHMCQMQPCCISPALQNPDTQISLQRKVWSTENKEDEGRRERQSDLNKTATGHITEQKSTEEGGKEQNSNSSWRKGPKTLMNCCKLETLSLSLCKYCQQNFRVWGLRCPWLSWILKGWMPFILFHFTTENRTSIFQLV